MPQLAPHRLEGRRYRLPRGVYHSRVVVHGVRPWYAIKSDGSLLALYRPRDYETDAEVVTILRRRLDREDPKPRHLALVTVTPARSRVSALGWLLPIPQSLRRPAPPGQAGRR